MLTSLRPRNTVRIQQKMPEKKDGFERKTTRERKGETIESIPNHLQQALPPLYTRCAVLVPTEKFRQSKQHQQTFLGICRRTAGRRREGQQNNNERTDPQTHAHTHARARARPPGQA